MPTRPYHSYDWSRAHVLDQAVVEGLVPQVPVMLPQLLFSGLGEQAQLVTSLHSDRLEHHREQCVEAHVMEMNIIPFHWSLCVFILSIPAGV